ncbi:MAG: PH domain-containing protein [Hamadaea sp.]|uniref:PH domain-containing protein n=1 Tax=Hamadaea sp. TaxID=2024425 RepID=UPI0017A5986D|nr:PH domain-containing protein [Hamadaea sp.]NUR70685.1 PH domain-containing protein [Hamadaea sp.]NUT17872.1 PH domain-containing protein [Hamadaea sp.]
MTSFRQPTAVPVAGLIAAIGALPLLRASGWFVFVPLAIAAFAVWAWRSGTDADSNGVRVRALFASRKIAWSRIDAFVPADRNRVEAALTDGSRITLTAVRPEDLPRLVQASGKALEQAQ